MKFGRAFRNTLANAAMVLTSAVAVAVRADPAMSNPSPAVWKPGTTPPTAGLDGENGGKLDGQPWDYKEHLGKVQLLFYVDPDHETDGNELQDALKAEDFALEKVHSTAIVNMKATTVPNFLIGIKLSSVQKKFPHTVYCKDFTKHLVQAWGLQDDAYDFLVLNPKGELIYSKAGKPDATEIKSIIELIRKNLPVAADPAKK